MSSAQLASIFTYAQARQSGMSKRELYRLRDEGKLETLGRGLYRWIEAPLADHDLLTIAGRAPLATLCLTSALAAHGLTDTIPLEHDVALPRGAWRPKLDVRIHWHSFDPTTFELGRESLALDATTNIGLYNAERSVVDAFRLRREVGSDVAHEALRRWLRGGGQPARLLSLARQFPRTEGSIRRVLEVLG